jgi:serine/threonine-protein kinase
MLDLRMQCLQRRKERLHALARVLVSEPDGAVAANSVQAAMRLPALLSCADREALTAAYPPPEQHTVRTEVARLERELDRAEALEQAGRYPAGLRVADTVLRESRPLEYPPLAARALFAAARLSEKSSDPTRAEALLRSAFAQAAKARDDALLAHMWSYLIHLVGIVQARHDDALALRLSAETAVERADDELERSRLLSTLGGVLAGKGQFAEAMHTHRRALAIGARVLAAEHPAMLAARNKLGNLQYSMGNYQDAIATYEQVLALRESTLGPMHPDVARALNNMGIALSELGKFEPAQRMHERALAIREAVLGPEHLRLASSLNNLGLVLQRQGLHRRSRALHERALAIRVAKLGPEHPLVASAQANLGVTLHAMGEYQPARELFRTSLKARRQRLEASHPRVASSEINLADLELAEGAVGRAAAGYRRALAGIEESLGGDHSVAVSALSGLARVAIARGQWRRAREHLDRALAIQERTRGLAHFDAIPVFMAFAELHERSGQPGEAQAAWQRAVDLAEAVASGWQAECRFGLARSLWAGAEEYTRAIELATRAAEYYRTIGHSVRVQRIERWLATHPDPR